MKNDFDCPWVSEFAYLLRKNIFVMMINEQLGRADSSDPVMAHSVAKGVAPCFPHQVALFCFTLGSVTLHILLRRRKSTWFHREMDSAWWCSRGWQIERTNTGLVWTEKTLFLVSLSFRKATKPLLKGQEWGNVLKPSSKVCEVLFSLFAIWKYLQCMNRKRRPRETVWLAQAALLELVGVVGCQSCPFLLEDQLAWITSRIPLAKRKALALLERSKKKRVVWFRGSDNSGFSGRCCVALDLASKYYLSSLPI